MMAMIAGAGLGCHIARHRARTRGFRPYIAMQSMIGGAGCGAILPGIAGDHEDRPYIAM